MKTFQAQLHDYLDNFTSGSAASAVLACPPDEALDMRRRFADRGRSRRPEHIMNLHSEILKPAAASKLSELDGAIATWEYHVRYWEMINPDEERLPKKQKELLLISLCSKDLQ